VAPIGSPGPAAGDATGFSFTTNSAVAVGALDYILPGASGGVVRLYDGSGTTLASATVLSTDPTESTGGFTYNVHAIAPVALAANTTYFVVADLPADHNNVPIRAIGVTTNPAITYGMGVLQIGSFGNPTTDANSGFFNPGYFSPNFDLVSTAVPEVDPGSAASALALLASGALILTGRRRRRLADA
jgi:hypothetical protein